MRILFCILLGLMLSLFSACNDKPGDTPVVNEVKPIKITPVLSYSVVAKYPHDPSLYTEGLLFHDGKLLESTGSPSHLKQTRSLIGVADLKSGKLETKVELDKNIYFGEGIAVHNGKLYQLTYTNQQGFVYDIRTFNRIGQFGYANKEGWGITSDGTHLIFSDGTFNLTYLDPASLTPVKTLEVTENGYAVQNLNELEYINGFIYANVWLTNRIVKIDPASGEVAGALDLEGLFSQARSEFGGLNELNGIAYDAKQDRILVTGKFWPNYYEITFPH